jgi:cell division protein FtsL
MLRILNVFAIAALIGSAVYAYSIKYETILFYEQIVKTQNTIQHERDNIETLRAEWAYLVRPARIQALADQHLALQQLGLDQIVKVSDLPNRVAGVDAIGHELESLGLAKPTNTPHDDKSALGGAATPSSAH